MDATLIYRISSRVFTKEYELQVRRELYKINGEEQKHYPEGYRFGWIAYDSLNPNKRVLYDCHPSKGAHYHLDGEEPGTPFEWQGLEKATQAFWHKVWEHFGPRVIGDDK